MSSNINCYLFDIMSINLYICCMIDDKGSPKITKEQMGLNPFLNSLKIEVNKVTFERQFAKDKDGVWLPVERDLEVDKSCRIYLSSGKRLGVVSLSARAKDLLIWIIYETEPNNEWVWINKKRYMKESGISSVNTYKGALFELIKTGYLLGSVMRNTYWINPDKFFNGNRVTVFSNNIIKK